MPSNRLLTFRLIYFHSFQPTIYISRPSIRMYIYIYSRLICSTIVLLIANTFFSFSIEIVSFASQSRIRN